MSKFTTKWKTLITTYNKAKTKLCLLSNCSKITMQIVRFRNSNFQRLSSQTNDLGNNYYLLSKESQEQQPIGLVDISHLFYAQICPSKFTHFDNFHIFSFFIKKTNFSALSIKNIRHKNIYYKNFKEILVKQPHKDYLDFHYDLK